MASLSLLVLENPLEQDVADSLSGVPFVEGFAAVGRSYIGNWSNAERLLRPDHRRRRAVPCRWIAGYRTEANWLDAMLVDLTFWQELLLHPAHDAWTAAKRTYKRLPLARELRFAVFKNGFGGVLLDSLDESEG